MVLVRECIAELYLSLLVVFIYYAHGRDNELCRGFALTGTVSEYYSRFSKTSK
jgi:hypothetical protein